jgi:hypothetical protein
MPWIMNMTDDRGSPFVAARMQFFKRVVVEDHEALELKDAMVQFNGSPLLDSLDGTDDYEKKKFLRAQHEVGRAHYCLRQDRKTLPARMGQAYMWVCDRFKTILEELEPGLRQYVPVEIRMRDRVTPWPEPYWYMRNNHFVDSIVPAIGDGDPNRSKKIYWNQKSQSLGVKIYDGTIGSSLTRPVSIDGIVLSEEALAGVHFGRSAEIHISEARATCSCQMIL